MKPARTLNEAPTDNLRVTPYDLEPPTVYPMCAKPVIAAPLNQELQRLQVKVRDADRVMYAIDCAVKRQHLSARSEIADARQNYGEPFNYEYPPEAKNSKEDVNDDAK